MLLGAVCLCLLVWVPEPVFLLLPYRSTLRYGSPLPSLGFASLCCCPLVKCDASSNTRGLDMCLAVDKVYAAGSLLFERQG